MAAAVDRGDEAMANPVEKESLDRLEAAAEFRRLVRDSIVEVVVPDGLEAARTAEIVRRYREVKAYEKFFPIVFERSINGLFVKRVNGADGRYSLPATYASSQELICKFGGGATVKIWSRCRIAGCPKETPCDDCDLGNHYKHIARFFYELRQSERLLDLDAALRALEARWIANGTSWTDAFSALLAKWSACLPAARAIHGLFLELLADYERMGSEYENSLSIR
jgi:hypothetical protein